MRGRKEKPGEILGVDYLGNGKGETLGRVGDRGKRKLEQDREEAEACLYGGGVEGGDQILEREQATKRSSRQSDLYIPF